MIRGSFIYVVALLAAIVGGLQAFTAPFQPRTISRIGSLKMAVKVTCSGEEPIEDVVKRFKRACNQSGHLMEMRFKEQWETAAEKKKRKAIRSRLLNRIERTNDRYEKRSFGVSEYNS